MAERNAQTMGRVERLAVLGQQITGLAQAMEDERDELAGFIAHTRPAAGQARLARQYAITNRWAARVRPLVDQLGGGYPVQTLNRRRCRPQQHRRAAEAAPGRRG
jgi:hypothetical protein